MPGAGSRQAWGGGDRLVGAPAHAIALAGRPRPGVLEISVRMASRLPVVLLGVLALSACGAPDYGRVTQWAATASLAADYPPAATGGPVLLAAPQPGAAEAQGRREGIRAMQDALTTYLGALSRLAADGVLPFMDDPFAEAATRAAAADAEGGRAVAALGQLLRRTSRAQARAPQLRATIAEADPAVQQLVAALARAAGTEGDEPQRRAAAAARGAALAAQARDPATRQLLADAALLRDRAFAERAAARAAYAEVLARIAEGHALLRDESRRLTQEETRRRIAEAEVALARAAARLPRLASAP